jgi:ribosomal protein S18 acetylase RimI-like enzyme
VAGAFDIRILGAGDAASWRALRLRALREDSSAFLATYDEDARLSDDEIARRLDPREAGVGVLGLFVDGRLAGMAGLGRSERTKARHRAVLWGMYIAPEARGRGAGEALLRRAIEHASSAGDIDQVELTVASTAHAARRLYERVGFVRTGMVPRAQREDAEMLDEDTMVLALRGSLAMKPPLAERSPSECVAELLAMARAHAARKRPADVRAQYGRDPFVAPSPIDLRTAHELDAIALSAAREFEAVLLSPLAPLASCAAVSPSHQDRIVTTIRGSEVVSDPTNVLALECARRLAADRDRDVQLCTIHQVVRAQRFPAAPGYTQHFRMLALAEAGLARADHGFEVDAFVGHVRVFWNLLDARGKGWGQRSASLRFAPHRAALAARVRTRLAAELPQLAIDEESLDSGYYDGIRLLFDAESPTGARLNLSDTGLFDWAARLVSDHRLRFVASGMGLQRLALP